MIVITLCKPSLRAPGSTDQLLLLVAHRRPVHPGGAGGQQGRGGLSGRGAGAAGAQSGGQEEVQKL